MAMVALYEVVQHTNLLGIQALVAFIELDFAKVRNPVFGVTQAQGLRCVCVTARVCTHGGNST